MLTYVFAPDQLFSVGDFPKTTRYFYPVVPKEFKQQGFNVLKIVYMYTTMEEYQKSLEKSGLRIHPEYTDTGYPPLKGTWSFEHPGISLRTETVLPTPGFLIGRNEDAKRLWNSTESRAGWQTKFYKEIRRRFDILLEDDGRPVGGKWTYDVENRSYYDCKVPPPEPVKILNSRRKKSVLKAWERVEEEDSKRSRWIWGGSKDLIFPLTRRDSKKILKVFFETRLDHFGRYQDAIVVGEPTLFHSVLSASLNSGLLTPLDVLREPVPSKVPLASLEGFYRQVFGWREFARAGHASGEILSKNDMKMKNKLDTKQWWNPVPDTGNWLLDHTLSDAWNLAYLDHIRRLMVVANWMQLNEIDPEDAYRWFLSFSVDAYPWVMTFNVFAMGMFSSRKKYTSKPYVSSSNYLSRMVRDPEGKRVITRKEDWAVNWDNKYKNYIKKYRNYIKREAPRFIIKSL